MVSRRREEKTDKPDKELFFEKVEEEGGNFFQELAEDLNSLDGRGRKEHLDDYAKVLLEDALVWSIERKGYLDKRIEVLEERASSNGYESLLQALQVNKDSSSYLADELGASEDLVDRLATPFQS